MDSDFYTAYLLHRRPFSDSQVMLDMLVEGVGQLRLLARISGRQATKHKASYNHSKRYWLLTPVSIILNIFSVLNYTVRNPH